MREIRDARALTPVDDIDGLYFKREDLFRPFDDTGVNGGKLRQCYMLLEQAKDDCDGAISCCSIHSPQAPITAAVAQHFGMPCEIFYRGTNRANLMKLEMPELVMHYGAHITIASASGRHSILYSKARKYAEENNYFVVEYGFNLIDHFDLLTEAVSMQVQNIPDDLENLFITCGSGITTSGVLLGLKKYGKRVGTIHLVCTAPDRSKLLNNIIESHGIEANLQYHDLFHREGFQYEKGLDVTYGGLRLHPNYEAKTFSWLYHESGIDIHNGKNLFWIVGALPQC